MKKRIIMMMVVAAMTASLAVGCGSKKDDKNQTESVVETKNESESETNNSTTDRNLSNIEGEYLDWTQEDFANASEEDKIACAKEYLILSAIKTAEVEGNEILEDQLKEDITDEVALAYIPALESVFEQYPGMTIKKIIVSVAENTSAMLDAMETMDLEGIEETAE